MTSKIFPRLFRYHSKLIGYSCKKYCSKSDKTTPAFWKTLKDEFDPKNILKSTEEKIRIPKETDILVIGGGAIGSSVAYFLKQRHPVGFSVTVVDKDLTYQKSSTVLSVGGIRQQFSEKENILMSMFSAEFYREIKEKLSVDGQDPPDIQYNPQGYLFLASANGASTLEKNVEFQRSLGARTELMSKLKLKEKFPWLNTDGLECGSYGLINEGWFDPWLVLHAFKSKAVSLGTEYVQGEVVNFIKERHKNVPSVLGEERREQRTACSIAQILADGEVHHIKFLSAVICAGAWSGEVGFMAGMGEEEEGVMAVPIPVIPRKRYVYAVHCPGGPGLECPLVIDPSGTYFRREGLGGLYLCGASPAEDEEPDTSNLDVDFDFFHDKIWPTIAHRAPGFECLKDEAEHSNPEVDVDYFERKLLPSLIERVPVFKAADLKSAWAGYYDYNYFDQNLIIGCHPNYTNILMATGCSGHGIQHAPAIGRAISELIVDDEYQTIDLNRLSFERIIENRPVFEDNIV